MKRFKWGKWVKQTAVVILLLWVLWVFKPLKSMESFSFLAKPHLVDGDAIYIKTSNGKYLTSCDACFPKDANIDNRCSSTVCLRDIPYQKSQFIYHKHNDGTFGLETVDGKYWKRCAKCIPLCPHTICSDGINPNLQTHKFVLIKNNDGNETISIKTDNGRLLEVTDCNQTCGKIITALGLNLGNNFMIEKVISPIAIYPVKKEHKKVSFAKHLPREFPEQWPFSQN